MTFLSEGEGERGKAILPAPRRLGYGGRLEQLDHIAGRILSEDLLAAGPFDNIVAETHAMLAQLRDGLGQVVDLDHESIPAAGFGHASIGHRPGGGGIRTGDPKG